MAILREVGKGRGERASEALSARGLIEGELLQIWWGVSTRGGVNLGKIFGKIVVEIRQQTGSKRGVNASRRG
jgi:hypothetical protein